MIKKYSIPAFFTAFLLVSSCSKYDYKNDNLSNYSKGFENEVELMKLDEPEAEKKLKEIKAETAKPEKPEEVVIETKEEKVKAEILKSEIADQPEFIKRFNATYLGVDVADFFLQIKKIGEGRDSKAYQMRIFTRSNGFVDYLFGWRDHTISRFRETKDRFLPELFKTKLLFKKKTRETEIVYDAEGVNVIKDVVNPPDNRDKRPAVPDNLKKHTYDPLSMAMEARKMIIRAVRENNFSAKGNYNFSLPMYDGRRRTDLMFSLSNKKVDGNYALKLTRKPVSGFTNNELTDIGKGDVTIDLYLDPKSFTPVLAEGRNFLGTASIAFAEDCKKAFEECVEGSKKK